MRPSKAAVASASNFFIGDSTLALVDQRSDQGSRTFRFVALGDEEALCERLLDGMKCVQGRDFKRSFLEDRFRPFLFQ
jgi:hypothetical protein